MTAFYIIRTAPAKERAVAKAIEAMGYTAWVPVEVRFRSGVCRGHMRRRIWETPAIAQHLFAALPEALHGDLQSVKGFEAIWRDCRLRAVSVAPDEVAEFRAGLDASNARMRRDFDRLASSDRPGKKPKRYRGFDALKGLLDVPAQDEIEDVA